MLGYYGGSYPLAIAAYNAGPGNVYKWIAQNGDPRLPGVDVLRWIESIPYYETKSYVQRVLENAVVYDLISPGQTRAASKRSAERRVGKECVRKCRSRWSPYHSKKKKNNKTTEI